MTGRDHQRTTDLLAILAWWREMLRDADRISESLPTHIVRNVEVADPAAALERLPVLWAAMPRPARSYVDDVLAAVEVALRGLTTPDAPRPLRSQSAPSGRPGLHALPQRDEACPVLWPVGRGGLAHHRLLP